MILRWADSAILDMDHIASYVREYFPAKFESTFIYIADAVENLLLMPHIGRMGRVEDTREWVIASLPYVMVYKVGDAVLEIVRVIHTSRRYP